MTISSLIQSGFVEYNLPTDEKGRFFTYIVRDGNHKPKYCLNVHYLNNDPRAFVNFKLCDREFSVNRRICSMTFFQLIDWFDDIYEKLL